MKPLLWFLGCFIAGSLISLSIDSHRQHQHETEHTQNCALYWSYTRTHVDSMQVLFRCGAPK